jgi:hypothetical protein
MLGDLHGCGFKERFAPRLGRDHSAAKKGYPAAMLGPVVS